MTQNTQERIIKILADQAILDISDVAMQSTLDDLGIDSMALVECIFAIEETFDLEVPFNANEPGSGDFDISTVASIVSAVERLLTRQPT